MSKDLTIVIAAYNAGRFIQHTLDSAQSCEPAQIIVADDASADGTAEVARRWAESCGTNVLVTKNSRRLGIAANWNRAMELVETPFALKLDHDDLVLADYAFLATQFLRSHPHVGIVGAVGQIREFCADQLSVEVRPEQEPHQFVVHNGVAACRAILRWDPYPVSSSTVYRTSVWRQVGGFDEKLSYCNDREIWFHFAREGDIAFYTGPGAIVRLHSENYTLRVLAEELVCLEFDRMFTSARKLWPERSLTKEFAKVYMLMSRSYLGSAWRLARKRPRAVPYRVMRGVVLASRAALLSCSQLFGG